MTARARDGHGCPFYAGQRVTEENCLATLFPRIAAEWDTERNHPVTPRDVTSKVKDRVWWRCSASRQHVFEAPIAQRTRGTKTSGCPFCRGMRVPPKKSLAVRHPEVARAWDLEANAPVAVDGISPTSQRLVWWRCPIDQMRWRARIADVASGQVGCPRCSA